MLAFWLTYVYFNVASNNVNKKMNKKTFFLVILPATHEIGPCCNLARGGEDYDLRGWVVGLFGFFFGWDLAGGAASFLSSAAWGWRTFWALKNLRAAFAA